MNHGHDGSFDGRRGGGLEIFVDSYRGTNVFAVVFEGGLHIQGKSGEYGLSWSILPIPSQSIDLGVLGTCYDLRLRCRHIGFGRNIVPFASIYFQKPPG